MKSRGRRNQHRDGKAPSMMVTVELLAVLQKLDEAVLALLAGTRKVTYNSRIC